MRMALLGWLQLCQGNGYYLTLAVLIYGYLMLHASGAASAANATTTAATTALASDNFIISNISTTTTTMLALNKSKRNAQIDKRDVAHVPDDDYDASYPDDIDDLEALINNKSGELRVKKKNLQDDKQNLKHTMKKDF